MAFDPRSKRLVKKKVIYSPSDPLLPDHYLIYIEKFDEDFIVKKSSIKHQSNGKILISIGGTEKEGEIITSGTKSHCETEFGNRIRERSRNEMDDETDSIENESSSHSPQLSTSQKKSRSYNSTPRHARTNAGTLTTSNRNQNYNSTEDIHRSRSDVQLYHKSPPCYRKNNNNKNDARSETDEGETDDLFLTKSNDHGTRNEISSMLTSLDKKLDFVARKINQVFRSSSFKESQLEMYRNDKDSFLEEVVYGDDDLLDISAKNPGDYGRKLLRILYTSDELKTSMLPSTIGNRYFKPKLDAEKFQILHTAMLNKFRINKHRYEDFYKNLVRKKLSDFLLEEERRERNKASRRLPIQPQPSIETSNPIISCPTLVSSINPRGSMTNDEQ